MIKDLQIRINVTAQEEPATLTPKHRLSTDGFLSLLSMSNEAPSFHTTELTMVPHRESYLWVSELRRLELRNSAFLKYSGQIHGRILIHKPLGLPLRR